MLQQNTTKRLGYWLVVLHRLFDSATERALASEEMSRREWQVLHAVFIGSTTVAAVDAALAPFLAEDGIDSFRPALEKFATTGWIVLRGEEIEATEAGTLAHARADELVNAYAGDALKGISAEEFLAANDVLRRIAVNLDPDNPEYR